MDTHLVNSTCKKTILALGAESSGNFAFFKNGVIHTSEDFGDLFEEENFKKYSAALNKELRSLKPSVIISDLHPDFVTTHLAKTLADKYHARHISVQHHTSHVFSAIGDELMNNPEEVTIPESFLGIACDGTGYAEDGTVWGGEILKISKSKCQMSNKEQNQNIKIERVGHLEHQTLLGGARAIEEPARVLIAVLSKFLSKEKAYTHIKKHYTKNEFELLWNQLDQKFNCIETSSTARILDAVSLLLGFTKNKRAYKHEPVGNLEKNSTIPYAVKPIVVFNKQEDVFILKTTPLFEYLITNAHKDKKRLAATAQHYLAKGFWEITQKTNPGANVFFAGGMANNTIIASFLQSKGVYTNKKIPRGDGGISFGQIAYFLLTNSGD